jgi:radical SAM superfamily enzyme YgiQ (UPF0313 family)
MRVLLILAQQTALATYHLPVGMGYVSACLKRAGHEVRILNPNHSHEPLDAQVEVAIRAFAPQLVGLGGMAFHLAQIAGVAKAVRRFAPQAAIALGGPLVTSNPQVAMKAVPEAAFGIVGEGEHTTVELAAALESSSDLSAICGLIYRDPGAPGDLVQTPHRPVVQDLDSLPWCDYEGLGLDIYAGLHRPGECAPALVVDALTRVMPVLSSRGCPFTCTFCCHEADGRTYRSRSLDDLFAEIEANVRRFGINALFIYDDLFCLQRERLLEFCRRIAPMGLRWECSLTAGQVTPEILATMRESGCCCLSIGVESLSQTVLTSMEKRATKAQLERVLPMVHGARLGLWSNLIFGDPAETLATVTESLEWYANHPEYDFRFAFIGYHPGSRIYDEAAARGLIGDPVKYLLAGKCEINATAMSAEEFVSARLLADRALLSFGHAGRLESVSQHPSGSLEARCVCPYCGAPGRTHAIDLVLGRILSIHCPDCNRAYRVPLLLSYAPGPDAGLRLGQAQALEKAGSSPEAMRAALQRLHAVDPDNVWAWEQLIRLADGAGEPVQAATFQEVLISLDPYNPTRFEAMADRLEALGHPAARSKYALKAAHLRRIGVTQTGFIALRMAPDQLANTVQGRKSILQRSMGLASFLIKPTVSAA